MDTSTGFLDLGSLGKTIEYLKNGSHVGGWRGEDLMAVVVQDELVLEVPGPWMSSMPLCSPGVATVTVVEIFFTLADDLLVGPTIGAKSVAVEAFCPLLVVLAVEGLGVQRDDQDLAPAVRAVAVGQEGEDGDLIIGLKV